MTNMIYQDTRDATETDEQACVACEADLRAAAATLCQANSAEIGSTTVVCELDESSLPGSESLVREIVDDCELDADIRYRSGVFSVRFTRPTPVRAPEARGHRR